MSYSGRDVEISIVKETTKGETPSSNLKPLRYVSASLQGNNETVTSETVNKRRAVIDRRRVGLGASGNIDTEFFYSALDNLLESTFFNDFAAFTKTVDVTAVLTGNKINRATGSFLTDGFKKGQVVRVAGFATSGNNGIAVITNVTETDLTIANITLVNETVASVTFSCSQLINGNVQKSLSIEEKIDTDFRSFLGMIVNNASINVPTRDRVTCSFDFLGYSFGSPSSSIGAGYESENTDKMIDSSNNFPKCYVDGVAKAFTELNFSIANNLREQTAVGSQALVGIGDGLMDINVEAGMYFEDNTEYEKFINNTEFQMTALFQDGDDNIIAISLPRAKYTDATAPAGGNNADFVENLPFGAMEDEDFQYQIGIFKIPAIS